MKFQKKMKINRKLLIVSNFVHFVKNVKKVIFLTMMNAKKNVKKEKMNSAIHAIHNILNFVIHAMKIIFCLEIIVQNAKNVI